MPTLQFDVATVRRLVDHAKAAPQHRPAYGSPAVPGLLLVGDDGVYLMSSGIPSEKVTVGGKEQAVVAYAKGSDPLIDSDFYEFKRTVYGGDDGVDLLPLANVESVLALVEAAGDAWVEIKLTQGQIMLLGPKPKRARRPRKARA